MSEISEVPPPSDQGVQNPERRGFIKGVAATVATVVGLGAL